MRGRHGGLHARGMSSFILCHKHTAEECRHAFAAWRGIESPLRHRSTIASCAGGGHRLWWTVEASNAEEALAQLPAYVAERTEAIQVEEVPIP